MVGRTDVGENPLNNLNGDVDDVILPALEKDVWTSSVTESIEVKGMQN
jgi:hypothetical protein